MSLPWLSNDFKSKSPEKDEVIRIHSSKSRSRSRSKEKGRDRGTRGGNKGSRRARKRSGSSSSSSDRSTERVRLVAREEAKYLNSRLFVANIISKDVTNSELTLHFEKYGNVVDILIHPKNYAFIQYLKEDHARAAVQGEHGKVFKSWPLDVKMANEGRRPGAGRGRGRGRGGTFDREQGPGQDRFFPVDGPFDDPYRRGGPGPRLPRPPFDDPFFPPPDGYRRGYPDPWMPPSDDPYRRGPFPDPFRDPYPPVPAVRAQPPPPPTECEIFVVNSQLRLYGETIEDRIKALSIITAVTIMPQGRTAPQMLEELAARDGLFAIFINAQNEVHRSLTLNILHGTPQEHRNMPLTDAITLIGRSFEEYVEMLKAKANKGSSVGKSEGGTHLSPSQEVNYLLNLLADNRAVTIEELSKVIGYLEERRDKLVSIEGRPPAPPEANKPSSEEITNKILSIFSSAGGTIQGMNGSKPGAAPPPPPPPPPPPQASSYSGSAHSEAPSASGSNSNLINFDNPNVQKALDSLIQSSPGLMKNFNSSSSNAGSTTTPTSSSSLVSSSFESNSRLDPSMAGYPGSGQDYRNPQHYGGSSAGMNMMGQGQHMGYPPRF